MLPKSLDSDTLQTVAVVAIVVLVVASFLVVRFVTHFVTKIVLLGVMAGLAFGAWNARVDLHHCAQTCKCHVYGQDVHVPHVGCGSQIN